MTHDQGIKVLVELINDSANLIRVLASAKSDIHHDFCERINDLSAEIWRQARDIRQEHSEKYEEED